VEEVVESGIGPRDASDQDCAEKDRLDRMTHFRIQKSKVHRQ
jgi:hypothetical protein